MLAELAVGSAGRDVQGEMGMTHGSDTPALLERLATAHKIPYGAGLPPAPRRLPTPDGLAFNCVDWGGPGEPILFLHGGALTCHTWDLVCLAMRDSFHCVVIDLRGHGESAWADNYTIEACVNDVAAIIADFGWTRVHVVGMSLGGIIAAHYAATGGARANSLAMIDVAPNVDFGAVGPARRFMERPIADLTLEQLVEEAIGASARGERDRISYRYLQYDPDWPRRKAGMASGSNKTKRLWSCARQASGADRPCFRHPVPGPRGSGRPKPRSH